MTKIELSQHDLRRAVSLLRQEMTIREVSESLGISTDCLRSNLLRNDMYDEFKNRRIVKKRTDVASAQASTFALGLSSDWLRRPLLCR